MSKAELAAQVDPQELAKRLSHYTPLTHARGLAVYDIDGESEPRIMREVGRIRESEYRAMGAGRGGEVDIDAYDIAPSRYRQILVWDPGAREIVAMYRYWRAAPGTEPAGALREVRTSSLFTMSERFASGVLLNAVELGRSVVNSRSRAAVRGLHAVWMGLGALIAAPGAPAYFFGNVSVPASVSAGVRSELAAMLAGACPPGDGFEPHDVVARGGPGVGSPAESIGLYAQADHRGALATIRERLGDEARSIPPILLSYLKRSRRLWAFDWARDADFGNAWEVAIVIPVDQLTEAAVETFVEPNRDTAEEKRSVS